MKQWGTSGGPTELDTAIASYLAGLRRDRGVSQETLGAELGHDQSFVSKIEHGQRRVTVSEALLLGAALGVTFEELCAGLAPLWSLHVETSSIWERESDD
jgi:transcriptional regulator with XRE-family HTH domain